ncbi:hypothetical protein GCM10010313_83110 [Streptomyces violarus]|uniref:DUF1524 domain-containing protein n=1 Tax=Streptomyces violarus TaxID=67380 RepID=A0A7W5A018_9ACTN|nr:hypothetical protein [Streptomyces violarus]GHD35609.1 hypothetical protein GCM10010313_83110 [Streptomyces violarus]
MVNAVLRGLVAALVVLSATVSSPAHAEEILPLSEAVDGLSLGTESRDGYSRDKFRHWNAGDNPADGCHTRSEVLIHEAIEPPAAGPNCRLTGGSWFSYYDAVSVESASGLDIDHMVPLAEAWDSGASAWSAQRREGYANDQGQEASLVAVPPARTGARPTKTLPSGFPPPPTRTAATPRSGWVPSSAGT